MNSSFTSRLLLVVAVAAAVIVSGPLRVASADPLLTVQVLGSLDGGLTWSNTLDVSGMPTDFSEAISIKVVATLAPIGTVVGGSLTVNSYTVPTIEVYDSNPGPGITKAYRDTADTLKDGIYQMVFDVKQSPTDAIQTYIGFTSFGVKADTNPNPLNNSSYITTNIPYNYGAGIGSSLGTSTLRAGTDDDYMYDAIGVVANVAPGKAPAGIGSNGNPFSLLLAAGELYLLDLGSGANSTINITQSSTLSSGFIGSVKVNDGQEILLYQSSNYVSWQGLTLTTGGGTPVDPVAVIALSSVTNETIIRGGSGSMSVTLGNTGEANSSLGYTLSAAGVNIDVTGSPLTGSLAGGASTVGTVTVSSDTVGVQTLNWQATGNADNSPQSASGTLTVLDHAAGQLSVGSVDIGKVLLGATVNVSTTLSNAAGSRAALQIMGLGGLTGANVGDKLTAGAAGVVLSGQVNTSSLSVNPADFTVQVADDQAFAGKGATALPNQVLTVNGVVGWALANASPVSRLDFVAGEKLVASNVSNLAGLGSQVSNVGGDVLGSAAMLLYGTVAGDPVTVSMNWRGRLADEIPDSGYHLVSDVLQLEGIPDGTVYVLQMSYDPAAPAVAGNEASLAARGLIYLGYWDGSDWVNAIVGNVGGTQDLTSPVLGGWTGQTALGTWGVDIENSVVWAVLNHSSEFAVVPEPATMAFLAIGGLAMAGAGVMQRRRRGSR